MSVAATAYIWSIECQPIEKLILLAFCECGEEFEQVHAFKIVHELTGLDRSIIVNAFMSFIERDLIVNTDNRTYRIDVPRYMRRDPNRPDEHTPKTKSGYVYLLNEINGDHYKIGRTVNPASRLHTFKTVLPYQVEYEALIETEDMHSLEAQLHKHFADKRVDGEWFALDSWDVAYVKSLAVQS